ncbi:cytochrome P450 [Lasiosphaeria hispida]|uniref:Cytochrome P450 n=1 Tax=Lasiosphaeria hispida TaxID=260671 RepID=A0AAJ0HSQ0_9PEZI|nr:cytochrome P450 [Lasiosphaeria hispida]
MDSFVGNLSLTNRALLVAILVILTRPLFLSIYNLVWHPLSPIPGRKTWAASRLPFIWALIRGKIVQEIEDMHRRYGPIVRVAPNEVAYAHPDAWNDILQAKAGHLPFPKDPTWWAPMPGVAPGLVTALDHYLHAAIRRQLSPGFSSRALTIQEGVVHQYVDLLVQRWRETIALGHGETEVDVMRWFNYLTFDILGDLAFAESFECLQRSEYHRWISLIFDNLKFNGAMISARFYPMVGSMLARLIPASLSKAQKEHAQLVVDKVRRRLENTSQRLDFMSTIQTTIQNSDRKGGKGLPLNIVHSTFAEVAIAGSETTAMALSAALNLLIHNVDKMEVLVREIRGKFRGYDEITVQAVRDMVYLNAFLNEVLRLCPPVPWMPPRRAPEGGGMVCGKWLPGGTRVSITFTSMHREPTSFQAPSSFCPERWLPEAIENPNSPFYNDKRHAFQPFTIGPHSCIGQNLAWAEMRVALAKVLWTFDVAAPKDEKKWVVWESLRTFLLIEKKPIGVVVKLRAD